MRPIRPQPDSPELGNLFPVLRGDLLRAFSRVAARMEFGPQERLYEEGFPCPFVPFVVSGQLRVFKISATGREVTLYRVRPGQLCVLSVSCSVLQKRYDVIAESESTSAVYVVPGGEFRWLLRHHGSLQDFVFSTLSERLIDIISLVDDVAFRRVDDRLADYLLRATPQPGKSTVAATHAQLAIELGTSREVISRKLKHLERAGAVRIARGQVEVVDRAALDGIGHGTGAD